MKRGVGVAVTATLALSLAAFAAPAGAQVSLYDGAVTLGAGGITATPYGWNSASGKPASPFERISPAFDSSAGTLQIGYDRHFGAWALGLQSDWSWGHAEGCARLELLNLSSNCGSLNWYGTAAGRIGYAWDRLQAYTLGGAAVSQWDFTGLFTSGAGAAPSPDRSGHLALGWVLGGGLEYALGGAWSLRAEYSYVELGRADANSPVRFQATTPDQWDMRSHMLMFGLKRPL